jgi:hypothetical protein
MPSKTEWWAARTNDVEHWRKALDQVQKSQDRIRTVFCCQSVEVLLPARTNAAANAPCTVVPFKRACCRIWVVSVASKRRLRTTGGLPAASWNTSGGFSYAMELEGCSFVVSPARARAMLMMLYRLILVVYGRRRKSQFSLRAFAQSDYARHFCLSHFVAALIAGSLSHNHAMCEQPGPDVRCGGNERSK